MTDIASLGFSVDATDVTRGASELDKLTAASARAEKAQSSLGSGASKTGAAVAAGSKQATAAVNDLADAHVRAKQSLDSIAASNAVSAFAKLKPAGNDAAEALKKVTLSAGQTKQAMAQLPAQFTDIVTQLSGGQNPLLILIQQGGQIRDSFGGIGPAISAISTFITPAAVGVGIMAGAVGALGLAYKQGSDEADAFRHAITLTGNAAGVTTDQLGDMAANIDVLVGTQSQAAEALAALAGSGRVAGENLEQFGETAVRAQQALSQSVEDTVKIFADLAKDPVSASIKLNETVNYLTASVYDQIVALQEQGRVEEAAAVAQQAYANALNKRAAEIRTTNGYIEGSWRAIASAAKEAWDAMLGVGRTDTATQQIADLDSKIAIINSQGSSSNVNFERNKQARLADLLARRQVLQTTLDQANAEAKSEKESNDAKQAYIRASEENKKITDSALSNQEKLNKALEDYRRNNEAINKQRRAEGRAELDPQQVKKEEASIRTKFADKSGNEAARALLGYDVDQIQNAADSVINAYDNAQRLIDARRSAGFISDEDYYESKRELIALSADAEVAALQKANERIAKEGSTGKDGTDNQRKIADNLAKIEKIRTDTANKTETINVQQEGSARKVAAAYQDAESAAQSYLDTINRQYERDLDGIGKGDVNRSRNAGRAQIEDRYSQQLLRLESDKRRGAFDANPEQYDEELDRIRRFQQSALASYTDYYDRLIAAQGDWENGAAEAFANYADEAHNVAQSTHDLFTNAFHGMEDAVVQFAMTGKASFGDLAKSIIADIIRIQVRQAASGIFGAVSAGVGAYFGGGAPLTGVEAPNLNPTFSSDLPSFDVGTDYVPNDMVAKIHKGERILTASENRSFNVNLLKSQIPSEGAGSVHVDAKVYITPTGTQSEATSSDSNSRQIGDSLNQAMNDWAVRSMRDGGVLSKIGKVR